MKKSILILLNLVIVIGIITVQTIKQETLRSDGETVYFSLRPVDPRSLMQGDYMTIRYAILNYWRWPNYDKNMPIPDKGFIVIRCDSRGVAEGVRFQTEMTPLASNEKLVKYTVTPRGRSISIGGESYFFEEGTGNRFAQADFGVLSIDNLGNISLIGLADSNLTIIK